MRILILQDDYWPHEKGGAAIVAKNLAKNYINYGHEVVVVTTVQERDMAFDEEAEGVLVRRIYSNYHPRWRAYRCLYNPQVIKQLRKILNEFNPEIVHAHNVHMYLGYYTLKLARNHGAKVYLTAHDTQLFTYGKLTEFKPKNKSGLQQGFQYYLSWWMSLRKMKLRYNPLRNFIINFFLHDVKKIIAVSRELERSLNQYGICNTIVIYNGVNISDWVISQSHIDSFKNEYALQNKEIILFGGRISTEKGFRVMIDAFSKVLKKQPDLQLLVMGQKSNTGTKNSVDVDVAKNIVFTGWISGRKLKAAYHSADLVVVPSLYLDPFPTVNLEAMACQKPVVGTCFGGTPEIVKDNNTGIIINPFFSREIADAILKILSDRKEYQRMCKSAHMSVVENFSLSVQVEKYLELFEEKKNNNTVV